MKVFDAHCDVLYRLFEDKELCFQKSDCLQVDFEKLQSGGGKIQCFAIFVSPEVPHMMKFQAALEMIDLFHEHILSLTHKIKMIKSQTDISVLKEGEIGAILTLEGCEVIDGDLTKLRTLFRLGVTSVGLTWNDANLCADGAMEARGAGVSEFGRLVVEENNKHHIWTDVSHLSEAAFWDVIGIAEHPIASHSNAKALCNHPRNLTDEQIKALIKRDGVLGVTLVPAFLKENEKATVDHVLHHIEHICELGGEHHLGLGSDFDGTHHTPKGLDHFGKFPVLIEALLRRYPEKLVQGFCYENFVCHFPRD